ncbi:cytochrome c oxidase subunit 2 [Paenibacillus uliginis N3/975]|uniref:Cytochrome c oxidase subunit 2 n=1 Tax=Paenibacillus uliginis N3/975 TaxID=1313296 RepID=A0A1X7GV98_9BACL|nr:cytochrome C oxidase subunit II [Paenibacillus uliginis]SMF74990.1 cytochrome c oxidase subunit 2 [Paenibacillus uliginis N3/975]
MKKTLALITSCMLLLLLAACGGDKEAAPTNGTGVTDTGVAPEAELVISGSNYQFDQPEYTLKKGVPVKITFKNEEGNHGVLIPVLNLQLDSKNNTAVVTPDKTGEFDISCSIMCGPGHTKMISKLIIEE